jgi:hypothetical protein
MSPWQRLDILCVECERKNCCTCCTSYWCSNCGQGRSGLHSPQPRRNTRRNNLVRILSFPVLLRADVVLIAVDTSLPPSEVIADSVKRSSRAHVFHFYALLCEIVSVPRKAPSTWVVAERLASGGKGKEKDEGPIAVRVHHPLGRVAMRAGNGSDPGRLVSLDARALAQECLKEVGRELGVPR